MIQRNNVEALYLHVPFCKTICYYCDFTHRIYQEQIADQWLETIKQEIQQKHINTNLQTIYIGGGTPVALSSRQLDELLTALDPYTANLREYTIEINPEVFTLEKAQILKKHGINRVSIGFQTSDEKLLKLMNRHHTMRDMQKTIHDLHEAGITNISLDLMYSLPLQTMDMLKQSIDDALSLHPTHLSLYSLTIEENTVFAKKGYEHLDDETEANMYEYLCARLPQYGYQQYEVSNFAKAGYESLHNQAYWNYNDFYGIGMGASGKENHVRYDHTDDFAQYFADCNTKQETVLTKEDEMFEMLMMGIRLKKGMNMKLFEQRFQQSFLDTYAGPIQILTQKQLVMYDDTYFRCTDEGYEIMNSVLLEFME